MLGIDTNLIVRYLADDDPEQSARARTTVDAQTVFVTVTAILEAEWVLRSGYGYSRIELARALRAFASLPNVVVEDAQRVANALEHAERGMDFADALHLERSAHCDGFASFDRKFVKAAQAAGYKDVREA